MNNIFKRVAAVNVGFIVILMTNIACHTVKKPVAKSSIGPVRIDTLKSAGKPYRLDSTANPAFKHVGGESAVKSTGEKRSEGSAAPNYKKTHTRPPQVLKAPPKPSR